MWCFGAMLACLPPSAPTAYVGVRLGLERHCDASLTAEGARVAALARAQVSAQLTPGDPVHICIVRAASLGAPCTGLYGCSETRLIGGPRCYVAGLHVAWRATLVHEVLAALAVAGRLRGWPTTEAAVIADPRYKAAMSSARKALP